jgi:hypothetical protein
MKGFYVHIIESPSADDLLNNVREGFLLTEGLRIAGIKSYFNLVIDEASFLKAIYPNLAIGIKNYGTPIIHISAHGNKEGVQLSNNFFITWEKLRNILSPINASLNDLLILCISSCDGFCGCTMAMESHDHYPFFGLVGPTAEISISDTAIAFLTFYYRLFKGTSVQEAVEAMKTASGNTKFDVILAEVARAIWIQKIQKLVTSQVLQTINQKTK